MPNIPCSTTRGRTTTPSSRSRSRTQATTSTEAGTRAMADSLLTAHGPLLHAVSFAARAHRHQIRKDGQSPYVAHVFRVCLIVRHVFGIDDPRALMAAALHDAIEDTTTDFDDLEAAFGREVAGWAATLCKDKR